MRRANPAHTHGVNDPGHAHGVSDPGHTHSVSDPGHAHNMRINTKGSVAGGGYPVDADLENLFNYPTLPSFTGISLNAAASNIGIFGAATNIGIGGSKTNVNLNAAASGITINAQGGGGAHENMQPWLAKNKIIKY